MYSSGNNLSYADCRTHSYNHTLRIIFLVIKITSKLVDLVSKIKLPPFYCFQLFFVMSRKGRTVSAHCISAKRTIINEEKALRSSLYAIFQKINCTKEYVVIRMERETKLFQCQHQTLTCFLI